MKKIHTIDLWTEQYVNHQECFNGAFVDGFEDGKIAFDQYKVIKNCNCIITISDATIHIRNKHNAIVFYRNAIPVRLMVVNQETNLEECIKIALEQSVNNRKLKELYEELEITTSTIDRNEKPIYNQANQANEIDTGSCDRWNLLYSMLKGSYTESDTGYGKNESNQYEFLPDIKVKYELETDTEKYEIRHKGGFVNKEGNRMIIIQENSPLMQSGSQSTY